MSKAENKDLMTSLEAAKMLKVHPGTLANWRHLGVGPEFSRIGDGARARVTYSKSDLQAFKKTMTRKIARR